MATNSGRRAPADVRSGGKIVKRRRIAAATTPYDRPATPPPPPPSSPNWLTGLIFPATRVIASGAGKLLSSVFTTDSRSSLSSSSSSDSDSGSEDDAADNNVYDMPFGGVDGLNKNTGTSSEIANCFRKEPQLDVGKTETKSVIEQLVLQETFTREECNRLIRIINSRVVDCSPDRLREIPGRTVGSDTDTPDFCNKAVMEAKRWLEEKKVGSSSKSELEHRTCALNSVALPYVAEGEVGSPVDVAKSYMRARPPWSSPSIKHIELGNPSPMPMDYFKEGTPYSVGSHSFSPSKKRDSLASGSWNIQDEIRRVRSKATEDMLRTLPSTKIDLSPFSVGPTTRESSVLADKVVADIGERMHESNSLTATKSIDASLNLATGMKTLDDNPVWDMVLDDLRDEALSSNPALSVSNHDQDLEAIQTVDRGGDAAESYHPTSPNLASKQYSAKEVTDLRETPNANGFSSSQSSLFAGVDTEENPMPPDNKNPNTVGLIQDKTTNSIPVEESGKLVCEVCTEVPVVSEAEVGNENNSIATGSQDSSSLRYEVSQEMTQVRVKRSLVAKTGSMVEKQQRKALGKYNRRGRGRGK